MAQTKNNRFRFNQRNDERISDLQSEEQHSGDREDAGLSVTRRRFAGIAADNHRSDRQLSSREHDSVRQIREFLEFRKIDYLVIMELLANHTPTQIKMGFDVYSPKYTDKEVLEIVRKGRFGFRRGVKQERAFAEAKAYTPPTYIDPFEGLSIDEQREKLRAPSSYLNDLPEV